MLNQKNKRYGVICAKMPKFLIIQTAFIGDVVLATALVEKLRKYYPTAAIDFLLRKGNEGLLTQHPLIGKVWVWDKGANKYRNLFKLAADIRKQRYSHVINPHRFGSSGLITLLSGARNKIGFDKNPFSFCYTKKIKHIISAPYAPQPIHETERNQLLISDIAGKQPAFPTLYPLLADYQKVKSLQAAPYICIAPSSVWFTKQFPKEKWIGLINTLPASHKVYLLGGPGDALLADAIILATAHSHIESLCGKLNFLQSAALMQGAAMNYVNDSGPLHFASAVDAPVTAVFCSTVPAFGFGPLRTNGKVVEIKEQLYCRPCGLHGHKACPEGHFRCALGITNEQLLWWTSKPI
jgi:heptosyltransferase-2